MNKRASKKFTMTYPNGDVVKGKLGWTTYDDGSPALRFTRKNGDSEFLSVNLKWAEIEPFDGEIFVRNYIEHEELDPSEKVIFVRNYSEHKGLAQQLVDAGLGIITCEINVGPFYVSCYEVIITL